MICVKDCVILHGKWMQSNCDLAEFPESKYWWPSCMRGIFLLFRNVLKTVEISLNGRVPRKLEFLVDEEVN